MFRGQGESESVWRQVGMLVEGNSSVDISKRKHRFVVDGNKVGLEKALAGVTEVDTNKGGSNVSKERAAHAGTVSNGAPKRAGSIK